MGGSYSTFSASVLTLQKSMSCRPTGQISINISGGKAPYNIQVTSAPAGYAGLTNFNTTRTSDTIKDVPGGAYTIIITDSCGTSVTRNLTGTDMTLTSDVPASTLYPYLRATSTNDCNTAIPYSSYGVGSDWSYYWYNSSQFYEYAYVVGTGTPSSYTPLPNNDKRPVVTLTGYDYNSFCNSGATITSYVKPIGCNVTPTTVIHNTSSYLCNTSTAITDPKTYVIIGNCDSIYLETSLNELVGMCYPVSWKIEDTATHVIARSGTLQFPDKNISSKYGYSYKRGVTYKITATDASGRVFTAYWTAAGSSPAAMKIDVTYASGYYCKELPGVGGRDIRIYVDAEDRIYPGTIIKYVSGPQDLAMGPPGSADTLPLSYNYTNFYPNSYIRSTAGKKIMKAGTYVFEIITDSSLCLHPTKRTMSYKLAPYYSIENSNFTYTTMPNCNGLEVKMDGYMKLIDSLGVAANTNTYYRIVSGPPGVTVNTTNRAQVGTSSVVTLPWMPGTYIIGVNYSTSVSCQVYEFPVQVDLAERLHIDPFATSHYVCVGKVVGDIYVKAAAGMPNTTLYPPSGYRYTITAAGTTTPILSQNNTGNFENFGAANTLYDIKVEDDCGSFTLSDVRMLDLNSANVAFTLNGGKFCENQNVEIFCVSLGEAVYSWTGPGGFTSNLQFPKFPAATAQDGTYTVTVSPARCSSPSTGSVNIEIVHPQAPPLEVHNVTVCKSTTSTSTVDVVNLSGATPAPNCTLNWYDSYGLPMAPPTAVSNYRPGSYAGEQIVYYVSQVERGACESNRIPVILTIIANCGNTPSLTVNAPSTVCAGNTGALTVSGTVFGDILFGGFAHGVANVSVPPVTATNSSGALIVKFESDGSVTNTGVDLAISCTGVSGGGGSSPIYRIPVALASPLTITACSGRVQNTLQADTNQYQNSNHGYIVINPATPGAKVTVSGTADVEASYDYLTIYDGITTLPSGSSGLSAGHWISNNPSIAIVSGNTIIPVGSGSVTFSYISGNGVFTTSAVNVLGAVKISYPNGKDTFCTNESGTKLMSINGATPMSGTGITSSIAVSPASGLSIVTTSGSTIGTITPSTSTVGTYRIIYTLTTSGCDSKDTTWVTIRKATTFTYGGSTFCLGQTDSVASVVDGSSGGTYSVSPSGLAINPNTGKFLPSASATGTYTVTYTPPSSDPCGSSTTTVTILNAPGVTINYSGTLASGIVCNPGNNTIWNASVSPSGTGTWSISPSTGINFTTSNGQVNWRNGNTYGTYTVTYDRAGSCPATYTFTIAQAPTLTAFSYTGSPWCYNDAVPKAVTTLTGTNNYLGGTYSATPAGLNIDVAMGTITPSLSTPGTYTVTYRTASGCTEATRTTSVTILGVPAQPTPSTGSTSVCENMSGLTYSVTNVTGTTYTWTVTGTGWSPASGSGNSISLTSGTGTGIITVTPSNSCAIGTSYAWNVAVTPRSAITNINKRDTTICSGNAVNLTALVSASGITGTPTFRWYTTQTGTTTVSNPVSVSPTATTTYYVSVSGDNLCEGLANATGRSAVIVNVTSRSTASANISKRDTTICNGGTVNLNTLVSAVGVTDPVFRWYTTQTGATAVSNPTAVSPTATTSYYVSVEGSNLCEGTANVTGRATVTINVNSNVTPSFTSVITNYCLDASIPALPMTSDNGIIGTWSPAINNTQTTTYTFTPAAGQCVTGNVQLTITIAVCDNFLLGTVFPFVHEIIEEGVPDTKFNKLFPVVAKLYPVPLTTDDPIDEILNGIPLYVDTAVYYDGSTFIPGTPKNPGQMSRTNNPGLPINWSMLGKTQGMVDTISVKGREVPTAPVGLYKFMNVPAGDYVLVLSRSGYMMRFGKITVSGKGQVLGHRELIPGDINGDFIINSFDASLINAKTSSIGSPKYDSHYDLNASGTIDINDALLVNFYLGFMIDMYEETMNWLLGY